MTMPSVEVIPTRRPISLRMWAIIRTVVVFPFVPVTAMIGIRAEDPAGNSKSMTGRATYCGSPSVGWVCIRNPGAALTSTIAPPVSRTGVAMSGQMKSMPATSSPTIWAAVSAISTLSGWASIVRSIEVPPVDMLPVSASLTQVPAGRTSSRPKPWARTSALGRLVDLDPGQHLLVADAAPRVGVGDVDQLPDGVLAVAGHRGGDALGDRRDLAADDQAAVVVAGHVGLDDHVARAALAQRAVERGPDGLLGSQVEVDAPAVVAVERLDHAREAEPRGRRQRRASSLSTTSARGTGSPAESSSWLVRLLSDATSTPIADVREVIVARIRCWWTPCPNWTSECRSSRMNGMSRLTASSMSAWVDGPNACRSAIRIRRSSSGAKSKKTSGSSGATRWLTRRTAIRPASRPTCSSRYS